MREFIIDKNIMDMDMFSDIVDLYNTNYKKDQLESCDEADDSESVEDDEEEFDANYDNKCD